MPVILTKKSDTPGSIPGTASLTNLAGGAELAVNTADKRLFSMNSASAIIEVGTNPSSLSVAGAASVNILTATTATITTLNATSATVTNLGVTSLTVSSLSLTNATFTSATITTLKSTSATIDNLSSTSANITTLTGTTFGTTATTQLRGASAQITTATVTSANITTLTGTTFGATATTQLRGASGDITTLTGTSANITTITGTTIGTTASSTIRGASAALTQLSGTSAGITTVTGTTAGFSSANITQFQATSATATTLTSTSANITTLSGTNFSATSLTLSNALSRAQGGTGTSLTPTNGQLLIGNGSNYTLATITAGTGVTVTNATGSITIAATGSGGTVTSVTASTPLASTGGTTPNISISSSTGTGAVVLANNPTISSATITNLGSTSANIATLTGTTFGATATTQLRGASGQITTLTVTSANITTLTGTTLGTFTSGTVTNLNSTSANIATLTGTTFGTTATTQLRGASAQITHLNSTSATITTLTGTSANITNISGTSLTITTNAYLATSSGNVGIGTASPGQLVEASKSANGDTAIKVTNANTGSLATAQFFASNGTTQTQFFHTGTNYGGAGVLAGGGLGGIYNNTSAGISLVAVDSAGAIKFGTGGTSERMRIDSSGNVGIGTNIASFRVTNNFDAPATWGNDAANFIEMWQNSGTNALGVAMGDDSIASFTTNNGYNLVFATDGTERMRIATSTGNVGIGTASPSRKLEVGLLGAFRLQTGSVTMDCTPTAGATDSFVWNTSINAIYSWQMAGTERMRIDSSGNVGIGGTADAFAKTRIAGTLPTGSNTSAGFYTNGTVPSGSTSDYVGFWSTSNTQATSFTLSSASHFFTSGIAIGAGSTVTNQFGFRVSSGFTQATNNYGFYSDIASGSNRFNFYAAGTAQNYFAGDTAIGRQPTSTVRLFVQGTTTGTSDNTLVLWNSAEVNLLVVRNDGRILTGTAAESPYNLTTGSAANVFVDSSGILYRSTSSLRYKSDVTTATHGLADVLKLRSVTYKGKNDGDTVFGGLIAEEVHDAGLTEFVAYDKEGRPDALHYGNMVALLVKAVQELTARVAELEAK